MVVALMQQQGITPTPEAAAVSSSVAVSQDKEVPQNVSLGAHRNTVFSSSGSRAASPQETDETAQKHASDELEISP